MPETPEETLVKEPVGKDFRRYEPDDAENEPAVRKENNDNPPVNTRPKGGADTFKSASVAAAASPVSRPSEPDSAEFSAGSEPGDDGGRVSGNAGTSMPGVFTGKPVSGSASIKAEAADAPEGAPGSFSGVFKGTPRSASSARASFSGRLRGLPPLWGVDLVLILISVVGILLILNNLPVILLALAKFVFSILRFLFWLALLAGVVLLAIRLLRRRRW